jgi:hypothetical protein
MTNCTYKKISGSCAYPGNRNCCATKLAHNFFSESNMNEEVERFFHITKEQFQVLLRTLSQELVEQ